MSSSNPKKIFLIDASSFIFRAFFALPRLSTARGLPTNAIYGFVTMLLNVLEKHKPDYVVCVFDSKETTFRKEMYADYKANRSAPPDDLVPQFEYIHKVVESLGICRIAQPGFEADDIIATLVHRFQKENVAIVTGDKDLMQLVSDQVHVIDTMKNVDYGPKEVEQKLGVPPSRVTDYLGLIGDSSDNIPGVPGVGPKTAIALLNEYGTLENILKAAASDMKPSRRKELLVEHAEIALLSQRLATVRSDVGGAATETQIEEMKTPVEMPEAFRKILVELEFKTLALKFPVNVPKTHGAVDITFSKVEPRYKTHIISDERQWENCLRALSSAKTLAFDTQTRGEKVTETEIVGVSLCADNENSYYIPLRHTGDGGNNLISVQKFSEGFCHLFSDAGNVELLVAQNLKYDYRVFLKEGFCFESLRGKNLRFYDTMLAHYLIDPEEKHGLDYLSMRYLDTPIRDHKTILGSRPDFSHMPLEEAARYACLDAWTTHTLVPILNKEMTDRSLEKLFYEVEMPTCLALSHMEWNGVALDSQVLENLSTEFSKELTEIEKKIFSDVGHTFNLNSPKQLSEVLFGKLGLPVVQKTKTGFSTDAFVLEKLAPLHPVPALIVRYRELTKLKSTYVDVLPTLVEKDGKVHANFNQAVTSTGRLSSSNPNLQNIPIKTEDGRRIRKAFIASPGNILIGADYSQIELRLVAHLSKDKALIEAFSMGEDIHRSTAAEIFHVTPIEVTSEQRAAAKAINFGLIYGKTAFGLSQELKISRGEAQAYIDAYFKRYHGVKEYMEGCLREARKTGFVSTLFGRRRPIKDIASKNMAVRNNAERMAMNMPVQGTAADIMKTAMIRVHEKTQKIEGVNIVLQVHDELVLDVPKTKATEVAQILKKEMEGAAKLSTSLDVNLGQAPNWMDV